MANDVVFGNGLKDVKVNAPRDTHADFDSNGYAEIDLTDTDLLSAVEAQGAVVVDKEGTEEAITPETEQTAATLSAIVMRCADGADAEVRILDGSGGSVVFGPITIADGEERVIVFPDQISFSDKVYLDEVTGGLDNTTPGFLIP